jgi:N-acetylmuramoyl-L-alanine amidase-like protein
MNPPTILQPNYPPHGELTIRSLGIVTLEIVHHSVTGPDTTPLEIDRMHRGDPDYFTMIGYHYLIGRNGTIWQGRPIDCIPAAALGENTVSVDICLVGQYEPTEPNYNGPPPQAQLDALVELSAYVHRQIPSIDSTIGHHDAGLMAIPPYEDQCPGKDLLDYLPTLRKLIAKAVG